MQEYVEERTIAISVKAAKLSGILCGLNATILMRKHSQSFS